MNWPAFPSVFILQPLVASLSAWGHARLQAPLSAEQEDRLRALQEQRQRQMIERGRGGDSSGPDLLDLQREIQSLIQQRVPRGRARKLAHDFLGYVARCPVCSFGWAGLLVAGLDILAPEWVLAGLSVGGLGWIASSVTGWLTQIRRCGGM